VINIYADILLVCCDISEWVLPAGLGMGQYVYPSAGVEASAGKILRHGTGLVRLYPHPMGAGAIGNPSSFVLKAKKLYTRSLFCVNTFKNGCNIPSLLFLLETR
jgi:hypothetical protein